MSVYPVVRYYDVDTGERLCAEQLTRRTAWYEEVDDFAVRRFRLVTAEPHTDIRVTCYCCSCPDGGYDAACRNHGFAGQRPCEEHDQPGQVWIEEAGEFVAGTMPASVQQTRSRYDHAHSH